MVLYHSVLYPFIPLEDRVRSGILSLRRILSLTNIPGDSDSRDPQATLRKAATPDLEEKTTREVGRLQKQHVKDCSRVNLGYPDLASPSRTSSHLRG